MTNHRMSYHFRIYYLTRNVSIINNIKNKFSTIVSVNMESYITTDDYGAFLLEETERRGFITIRERSIKNM